MFSADSRLEFRFAWSHSYTIVGVVAQGREFPAGTDVWLPVGFTLATDPIRVNTNYMHMARMRSGATAAQVGAELTRSRGFAADPAHSMIWRSHRRLTERRRRGVDVFLLLMAVVCGALIVCANVAAVGMA
jgi:hypothetical protein